MATYNITHDCGCTVTHRICGPTKDRARKVSWLESQDCRECERAAINAAAAARAEAAALPTLTGSEKQVAWATTLREKMLNTLAKIEEGVAGGTSNVLSPAALAETKDAVVLVISEIQGQTEAHWWIENRHMDSDYSLRQYVADQVQARNLNPTAAAEIAAHNAARAAKQ